MFSAPRRRGRCGVGRCRDPIVGTEGDNLIGADVAETLVAGIERHDFVGADVAETLVAGIENDLGHG
jgi:hypothetical protein